MLPAPGLPQLVMMDTPSSSPAVLRALLEALGAREPGLVAIIRAMVAGDKSAARHRAATLLLVSLRPWPVVAKDIDGPVWQPLRLLAPVALRAMDRDTLVAVLPIAAASAVSRTALPRWLVAERVVEIRDHDMLAALVSIEFVDSLDDTVDAVIATALGVAPFCPTALQLPAADLFKVALWWG